MAQDLDLVVGKIRGELSRQNDVASARLAESAFVDGDTGRNVGRDELLALAYLRSVDISPRTEENEPSSYLERLLDELRATKRRFVSEEEDRYGFGAATFSEIIRFVEQGIEPSLAFTGHPIRALLRRAS